MKEALNEDISTSDFEKDFENLYRECIDCIDTKHDPELENSIGNLTLLSASINRSYGNSVFPVKKQCIINLSRSGAFLPLCTQNTFLKLYSDGAGDSLIWSGEDSDSYKKTIAETLINFFEGGTG